MSARTNITSRLSRVSALTVAVLALSAGVAACGGDGGGGGEGGGGEGGASGEPITFGILTEKTGALAALGRDLEYGVKAGVSVATNGTNEVAGRPIEFVVGDNQSDSGEAPRVARQMLQQDQPDVVFNFGSSASALAAAPILADAEVIDIAPIAASDELTAFSPTSFRTSRNATQEAKMGAEVTDIQQGETFMILAPDYAYGQSAAKAWQELLTEQGGKMIGDIIYAPLEARDYTAAAERVRGQNPDKLIVVTFASTGGPRLFQAIDSAGITDSTEVITLLPQRPTREALGPVATEIKYFAIYDPNLPKNEINKQMIEVYREMANEPPDIYAGDSAVAGMMAVEAIRKTDGDTSSQALVGALEGIEGESVKGIYRVRPEDHLFLFSFYEAGLNENLEAQLIKEFPLEASEIPVTKTIEGR